jgi:hypothetical protein
MSEISSSEVAVGESSARRRTRGLGRIRPGALEEVLFVAFVLAADAFSLGIVPVLGPATLVSFLAFVFLEEHLRRNRYRANGF